MAGPYRPWATLYRFPDGRLFWVIRLWEVDRPVRRLFSTPVLLAYADRIRLPIIRAEVEELVASVRPNDDA